MTMYFLLVVILVLPLLVVFTVQQMIIFPRLRGELIALNARRAERVRLALSTSPKPAWRQSGDGLRHSFARWVELSPDGAVRAAGQVFYPTTAFSVCVRDEKFIPRATASCDGSGSVTVHSHGQSWVVCFRAGQWEIQPLNSLAQ